MKTRSRLGQVWVAVAVVGCGADTGGTMERGASSAGTTTGTSSASSSAGMPSGAGATGSGGGGGQGAGGDGGAGEGGQGASGEGGDGSGGSGLDPTGAGAGGQGGEGTGGGGPGPLDPPAILSVFWGADGVLGTPPLDCDGFVGPRDGMPIVLSAEVDEATLDPTDIEIVLDSGALRAPACVKLEPADEENEDRTILLIGDLGTANDPPVEVRIVSSLMLENGQDALGASTQTVVGIEAGPSLVVAEAVSAANQEIGGDDDCPEGTAAIVRTIWSGGVDGDDGDELTEAQLDSFFIDIDEGDGTVTIVSPFAFGDLNDGDNNVDLCLDDDRTARRVRVAADTVTDPTNDWNDETEAEVTPD